MEAVDRFQEMARSPVIRTLTGPVAGITLSIALLVALFLLTEAAQDSAALGEMYSTLLVVNVIGIVALLGLIFANLWRLFRQLRQQALGSRLTLRLLGAFALLAVVPLSVVYYFSVQFLNQGIDSWFDVRIEQALDDAVLIGRTSLEAVKQDLVDDVREQIPEISEVSDNLDVARLLDDLRDQANYDEMSLFTSQGRIIASSNADAISLVPPTPDESILQSIRSGQEYTTFDPLPEGGLQLRAVLPIQTREVSEPVRALQVTQSLPLRYTKLGDSVLLASNEYKKMVFLRGPLKFSFVLTLSLITLMTMLIALWVALFISRRLMAPMRDLAEGTQAVAQGNYLKQLPVTSSDELGVLVQSFNDMTRQISHAQNQAKRSQREAEVQRTWLETILSHLSSGVLVFDRKLNLLDANSAAGQILGTDLEALEGEGIEAIVFKHPDIKPISTALEDAMTEDVAEWQTEVSVNGPRGARVLMCRGTRLTPAVTRAGGTVLVFDDVTDFVRAQRDAAWGDVARRLAHEIKNPLTPIQLSAERIRRKYLDRVDEDERDTLDRATRTIAHQVASMKEMVDAFASYSQPMRMEPTSVDLNRLIQDVAELHRSDDRPIDIKLDLDPRVLTLLADGDRLRQVLNNLFLNARDAMTKVPDPAITISTKWEAGQGDGIVEIRVTDNGPGFPDELIERIYEPYVTTKEKGTGLGLAIVKRIVEEHGGNIFAGNLQSGGASINIRLPKQVTRNTALTDPSLKIARS